MSSPGKDPEQVATGLITMLNEHGRGDYIGEHISQLEHCLQCANFAVEAKAPPPTIVAALLHDIGQFLPEDSATSFAVSLEGANRDTGVGRIGHERIGEEYLRSLGFPAVVTRLVGSHVAAKRYLTAVDERYYGSLSDASKKSLELQGGPFKGAELEEFERDGLKDEMVRLRKWDDGAKVVGVESETPRADMYWGMIVEVFEGRV